MKTAKSLLLHTTSLTLVNLAIIAAPTSILIQENSAVGGESQWSKTSQQLPEQRPPLPIHAGERCYLADASPLLNKSYYESHGYRLLDLNVEPLVIEETINLSRSLELRIEQRGCVDIYAKFAFTFKGDADQPRDIQQNIRKAAHVLQELKINSGALLNSNDLTEIAKVVERVGYTTPQNKRVICLHQVGRECIKDVSVEYTFPQLRIFYINRP